MAQQANLPIAEVAKLFSSLSLRLDERVDDKYNLSTFIPLVPFRTLSSPNAQIIFGRNGTGKTHLLKAFHQHCVENFETEKVLPVYIDLKTFGLSSMGGSLELSHLIHRYYRLFVNEIVETLTEFVNSTLTESLLQKVLSSRVRVRRRGIKQRLAAISEILDARRIEEAMVKYVRKIETSVEDKSSIKGGLSVALSGFEPKIKAEAGLAAEETDRNKEAIELVYGGLAVVNYDEVRTALEEIIELSGARAICVLVDEWSSIELKIQPVLAEMIKKTLAVSDRISLKIVALKFLTRTSASVAAQEVIGLQPGIDIFPIVDLDELLCFDLDQQSVKDFLTLMLYQHCCAIEISLKKKNIVQFEHFICEHLFADSDAYLEIVRASEGNPRDFLGLLASCSNRIQQRNSPLDRQGAVKVANSNFTSFKQPNVQDPRTQKLFRDIFQEVVKNKQKLFLLSSDKAANSTHIQQLWHYRFIHMVASTYTVIDSAGIPREYSVFSMDYSKLLTLKTQTSDEQLVDILTQVAGALVSNSFIALIDKTLQYTGLKESLISVAGRTIVSEVETADLNAERLVDHCIYDRLL